MVNEENDCHSHILEQLFSNHSKTMLMTTKVFSAVAKIFFDMQSLENIISDNQPNVSNKPGKNWCKSLHWLSFCMKLYVTL